MPSRNADGNPFAKLIGEFVPTSLVKRYSL